MNTKILMTLTSFMLALAGVCALFAPDLIARWAGASPSGPLLALIQLMGALYFGFALMNWSAKESAIGGIYARPVSLGNFAHFFIGTLLLTRYEFSAPFNLLMLAFLLTYAIFASLFYWLVFRATGGPSVG